MYPAFSMAHGGYSKSSLVRPSDISHRRVQYGVSNQSISPNPKLEGGVWSEETADASSNEAEERAEDPLASVERGCCCGEYVQSGSTSTFEPGEVKGVSSISWSIVEVDAKLEDTRE